MATIANYFEQAQLSMAAYALNLLPGMSGRLDAGYIAALTGPTAGMSDAQAKDFADTYTVVDQFTDSLTGFSGTVFADSSGNKYFAIRGTEGLFSFSGAVDWLTNVADVSWDGIAIRQGIALFNYLQRLQGGAGNAVVQYTYDSITKTIGTTTGTANGLLSGQAVSVTGHSLGGQLAMMMSRLAPGMVNSVYTYNAPGFDTTLRTNLFPLTSEGFFNLLTNAPIGPITGQISAAWNDSIMTHWNVEGDVVHDIGNTPGIPGMIFSENANQGVVDAHDIKAITDSLAIYNLFATLDPTLNTSPATAIPKLTNILKASSSNVLSRDTHDTSLENTLDSLRTLFQQNYANRSPDTRVTPTGVDDRDDFYTKLYGLETYLKGTPFNVGTDTAPVYGLTVDSLVNKSLTSLVTAAQSTDLATRYALYKLNPFTVSGNGLYEAINTGGALDLYDANARTGILTDEYLKDRTSFLVNKISSGLQNYEYQARPGSTMPVTSSIFRIGPRVTKCSWGWTSTS